MQISHQKQERIHHAHSKFNEKKSWTISIFSVPLNYQGTTHKTGPRSCLKHIQVDHLLGIRHPHNNHGRSRTLDLSNIFNIRHPHNNHTHTHTHKETPDPPSHHNTIRKHKHHSIYATSPDIEDPAPDAMDTTPW